MSAASCSWAARARAIRATSIRIPTPRPACRPSSGSAVSKSARRAMSMAIKRAGCRRTAITARARRRWTAAARATADAAAARRRPIRERRARSTAWPMRRTGRVPPADAAVRTADTAADSSACMRQARSRSPARSGCSGATGGATRRGRAVPAAASGSRATPSRRRRRPSSRPSAVRSPSRTPRRAAADASASRPAAPAQRTLIRSLRPARATVSWQRNSRSPNGRRWQMSRAARTPIPAPFIPARSRGWTDSPARPSTCRTPAARRLSR